MNVNKYLNFEQTELGIFLFFSIGFISMFFGISVMIMENVIPGIPFIILGILCYIYSSISLIKLTRIKKIYNENKKERF